MLQRRSPVETAVAVARVAIRWRVTKMDAVPVVAKSMINAENVGAKRNAKRINSKNVILKKVGVKRKVNRLLRRSI